MVIIMCRPTGQDPVHMGPTLGAAAQALDMRDKVIMAVIISSPVRVTSSISQDTRVIQSSLTVASITFSLQVFAREFRRFISMRLV